MQIFSADKFPKQFMITEQTEQSEKQLSSPMARDHQILSPMSNMQNMQTLAGRYNNTTNSTFLISKGGPVKSLVEMF